MRLSSEIRHDTAWQKSASDFMAEVLRPSYELVQRDLRRSSALSGARIAGKSLIFSIVAMEVGAAVGGAPTWASIASSATVAALSATADFAAARGKRAARKEYLRILGNFTGNKF
jgi:hypothetical protein